MMKASCNEFFMWLWGFFFCWGVWKVVGVLWVIDVPVACSSCIEVKSVVPIGGEAS